MTSEQQDSPKENASVQCTELSPAQKLAIREYMVSTIIVPGILITVTAAVAGYAVNELARGAAYASAYSEAIGNIVKMAEEVGNASQRVKAIESQALASRDIINKATKEIQTKAKEVSALSKKVITENSKAKTDEENIKVFSILEQKANELDNLSNVLQHQTSNEKQILKFVPPDLESNLNISRAASPG